MPEPSSPDQPMSLTPLPAPAEREAIVARLSSAFAGDVLSMDELDRRMTEAYRVSTRAELANLVADLPAPPPQPVQGGSGSRALTRDGRDDAARITVLFGSVERGGPREVPQSLEIRARFGNVELDLRASLFRAGVTEILVRSFCGNVEIKLPAGIAVENDVSAFLASVEGRDSVRPGATSTVRLVGRAVLSSVSVDVVPERGELRAEN